MKTDMAGAANREAWLRAAYGLLRRDVLPEAPEAVAVSWSFPSKGGSAASRRTIGECHYREGSAVDVEGGRAILVSPVLLTPFALVETLAHEMVHAALPAGSGHRARFSQLAGRIGLVKPWTSTKAGPELAARIEAWLQDLPAWPGGHLVVRSTQKGRQLKAVCSCEPARILRGSRATFEQGPILCGLCGAPFELAV